MCLLIDLTMLWELWTLETRSTNVLCWWDESRLLWSPSLFMAGSVNTGSVDQSAISVRRAGILRFRRIYKKEAWPERSLDAHVYVTVDIASAVKKRRVDVPTQNRVEFKSKSKNWLVAQKRTKQGAKTLKKNMEKLQNRHQFVMNNIVTISLCAVCTSLIYCQIFLYLIYFYFCLSAVPTCSSITDDAIDVTVFGVP